MESIAPERPTISVPAEFPIAGLDQATLVRLYPDLHGVGSSFRDMAIRPSLQGMALPSVQDIAMGTGAVSTARAFQELITPPSMAEIQDTQIRDIIAQINRREREIDRARKQHIRELAQEARRRVGPLSDSTQPARPSGRSQTTPPGTTTQQPEKPSDPKVLRRSHKQRRHRHLSGRKKPIKRRERGTGRPHANRSFDCRSPGVGLVYGC